MITDMSLLWEQPDLWRYISIPFIAGLVGLLTNWLAIRLTFVPIEFVGFRPFFGWQGIVPAKIDKMSDVLVHSIVSKLGSAAEIFRAMGPDAMARHLLKELKPQLDETIDDIMREGNEQVWENLPGLIKNRIYARSHKLLPTMIHDLTDELSERADALVDLKELVKTCLNEDKSLLNRIFLACGDKEFHFVTFSGLYFGFFFGLIQMTIWWLCFFYGVESGVEIGLGWLLPVFGFLVGFVTNWVALLLIFKPLNAKHIGPFSIQGMFLKRQKEVSEVYSQIVTSELLTVHQFVRFMLHGSNAKHTRAIFKKHVSPLVDAGMVKTFAQLLIGLEGFVTLKSDVVEKNIATIERAFMGSSFSSERAVEVEQLFKDKMMALNSEEFQALLRPAFSEGEFKLIVIGGVLGGVAGFIQLYGVFGLSLF